MVFSSPDYQRFREREVASKPEELAALRGQLSGLSEADIRIQVERLFADRVELLRLSMGDFLMILLKQCMKD